MHAVNLGSLYLGLTRFERRDTLVHVPAALRYRRYTRDDLTICVSDYGTVVVLQPLSDAQAQQDIRRVYEDDLAYRPLYRRATQAAEALLGRSLDDFDFSLGWRAGPGVSFQIEWDFVSMEASGTSTAILIDAVLIYELGQLAEAAIEAIPATRRQGRIDPQLGRYTQDLFGMESPADYLVSRQEIARMEAFYDAWGLTRTISRLSTRFDQATGSYAFYWEHAERRRDTLMNVLLGGIALLGLLQAQEQLHDLLGLSNDAIGYGVLGLAALLIVWGVYVGALADRRRLRAEARLGDVIRSRLS